MYKVYIKNKEIVKASFSCFPALAWNALALVMIYDKGDNTTESRKEVMLLNGG